MGRSDLQKLLDQKKAAKKLLFDECWPGPVMRGARQAIAPQPPGPVMRGARQAIAPQPPDGNLKDPLVIIFTTKEKSNHEMVFKLLEGLLVLPLHVVVVSEEEPADKAKDQSGKIYWFNPESGRNARKLENLILAADMAAVFDEKQNTIHTLFDKGVVVIGHAKSPLLENYHPNDETGNSFTYTDKNPWGVFAALVRACETFHFPYDWQHIIRGLLKVR